MVFLLKIPSFLNVQKENVPVEEMSITNINIQIMEMDIVN